MLPSWVLPYPSFICPLFPADLWILVCKGVEISEVSEPILYLLLFLFSSLSFFRACPVLGKHQNLVSFSPASSSFSSCLNTEIYESSMSVNGIVWWNTTSKLSARMSQTLNYGTLGYVKLIQMSKWLTDLDVHVAIMRDSLPQILGWNFALNRNRLLSFSSPPTSVLVEN